MSTTRPNDPSGMLLTLEDLRQLDGDTLVRIVEMPETHNPRYWRRNYNGYTNDIADAGEYTVDRMLSERFTGNRYELVTAVPPPAKPTEELSPIMTKITLFQAKSHREKIEAKMCRVVVAETSNMANGMYWKKPLPNGCTWNTDEAQEMRISTVLTQYDHLNKQILIEMVDQEMAAEIAKLPFRKCSLESSISSTLIKALVLHPEHPTYRSMLMARFNVMPPETLKTYEEIKDWIEHNCDEPPPIQLPPPMAQRREAVPAPARATHGRPFAIPLTFTQLECGSCNYSVPQRGTGNFQFSEATIRAYCEDSTNLEGVIDCMEDELGDEAWNIIEPNMEDNGDYQYDNHESGDPTDQQWSYRQDCERRRQELIAYLRSILTPEEQVRLRINQPEPERITHQHPPTPDMVDIARAVTNDEPIF